MSGCDRRIAVVAALAVALTACADGLNTPSESRQPRVAAQTAAAPAPTVTTTAGGTTVTLYPYTLVNFSSDPSERFDPINLIFTGSADPRQIRADLLVLDGNRPGLPDADLFHCVWRDAIGDMQTAYTDAGWAGSAIQLRCGEFGPVRFHVRLFRAGDVTVANAHFEALIENTADHQVLSWDLAEQLVTYDMARTGLLGAAPSGSDVINAATHREIPGIIYNALPADLRLLVSGSPDPSGASVPINNGDGRATVLSLAAAQEQVPGVFTETLPLVYGQAVPKPFCSTGPLDFLFVEGPITLAKTVTVGAGGDYSSTFGANATLSVTPIDPITGAPTGATYSAAVADHQESWMTDDDEMAFATVRRTELPQNEAGRGHLFTRLKVGPGSITQFTRDVGCNE